MRINYVGADGKRQKVAAEFVDVRQALYFAVNTGWLLEAKALSIESDKPFTVKAGKGKPSKGGSGEATAEGADDDKTAESTTDS